MCAIKNNARTIVFIIRLIIGFSSALFSGLDIFQALRYPSEYERVYTSEMMGLYRVNSLEDLIWHRAIYCAIMVSYSVLALLHYRYYKVKWLKYLIILIDIMIVTQWLIFKNTIS